MTEAQQPLVTDNIRLVYYLANKLRETGFVKRNYDDLVSEGTVGLVKAAAAFDPNKGVKFATFASRCVTNEMLMYIRRNKKHDGNVLLSAASVRDSAGNEMLLSDVLADERSVFDALESADELESLSKCLKGREAEVLMHLKADKKQREIAAEMGITQSYVSRIVKKIRKKHGRADAYG